MSNVHEGLSCKLCSTQSDPKNIEGTRHVCLICDDYDLCSACYDLKRYSSRHRPNHVMQACSTPWNQLLAVDEQIVADLAHLCCPLCGDELFSLYDLLTHCYLYHADNGDLVRCPFCAMHGAGSRSVLEVPLVEHLKLHCVIICDVCYEYVTYETHFCCLICEDYHLCSKCHEEKRSNKYHCSAKHPMQPIPTVESINKRLSENSGVLQIYGCPFCRARDFNLRELIYHCTKYHRSLKQKVRCPVCSVLRGPQNQHLLEETFVEHLKKNHCKLVTNDLLAAIEQECAICIDKITDNEYYLDCGHKFHYTCIRTWRKTGNMSCPICRYRS